ncbi:NAD-dependent epimerase/dehydratase family protein [Flagellimonas nanhaiensis]|nr:NAD(P)-dependent oxidoreductase [Allomuricauda nanhaiensis]
MNRIVVTGANGFAGSHVLESFVENPLEDCEVVAACRNENKLPQWFEGKKNIGDLLDSAYLEKLTNEADVICHTAAFAEMNGTVSNSNKYFFEPTKELIEASVRNGVKRFVFLSSTTSNPIANRRLHSKRALKKIWPHYYNVIRIENLLNNLKAKGMEVVILRVGFFTGKNYSLGILPILLPRLKTHLAPWVNHGNTSLPLTNGKDIGEAFRLSSLVELKEPLNIFDVVGKEVPTVKEVFGYLNEIYGYPLPHFNVSFKFAYTFARFMQILHKLIPGDPLIVPAIVLLLEETSASNKRAKEILGYEPMVHWKESIDIQIKEMQVRQKSNMKMNTIS